MSTSKYMLNLKIENIERYRELIREQKKRRLNRLRENDPEKFKEIMRKKHSNYRANRRIKGLPCNRKNDGYKRRRRLHVIERFEKIKVWFDSFKRTLKCQVCPENESVCLEFHHLNINDKKDDISGIMRHRLTFTALKTELVKCACVCSNCHKKIHGGVISPVLVPVVISDFGKI